MADFEKLIPTAYPVAKSRAKYTGIPYCKEMDEIMEFGDRKAVDLIKRTVKWLLGFTSNRQSYLEVRYASTNDGIGKLDNPVVLEIAAGFSPKGLEFTDRNMTYIETDLPSLIDVKKKLVKEIRRREGKEVAPNHYFLPLNICSLDEFINVGDLIISLDKNKPVAVVFEGLFSYLTLTEKKKARDNIKYFLSNYSPEGAWITPDLSYHNKNEPPFATFIRKVDKKKTGRTQEFFKSPDEVQEFLKEGGLEGRLLPNNHLLDQLTCIEKGIDPRKINGLIEQHQAYFITLK